MLVNNPESITESSPSSHTQDELRPIAVEGLQVETKSSERQTAKSLLETKDGRFSKKILNIGFLFALLLSGTCLVTGAFYLYKFMTSTNDSINLLVNDVGKKTLSDDALHLSIQGRTVVARIALLSCGVFVGMAFGFLGFALFLIGIKEEMNLDAGYENYRVKIARLSPGVFIILCSTILIGVSVTHSTPFDYEYIKTQPTPSPTPAYTPPPAGTDKRFN